MARLEEAYSNNKALQIHKKLNNAVEMATDHYNISFILLQTGKKERALSSLYNACAISQKFEKQNNYHHPVMDTG
jgi:hypothetical protein